VVFAGEADAPLALLDRSHRQSGLADQGAPSLGATGKPASFCRLDTSAAGD